MTKLRVNAAQFVLTAAVLAINLSGAHALDLDTSGRPALVSLEVCVHEGEGDVNTISGDVYPTIGDLVHAELTKFSRYVFVLTQGALMVDEVNINWNRVDCRTSDFDWQVLPDPACVTANSMNLKKCRTAGTRVERDVDAATGDVTCFNKTTWWSQIYQRGTAYKGSQLGLPYDDFGAEGFAHEFGHYLACLSDSYTTDRSGELSYADDMADNGVADSFYYKGLEYNYYQVENDGAGFPGDGNFLYVNVGIEDTSSVMSGAEMPNDPAKTPSNAVYDAVRAEEGMGSVAGTAACETRFSDDVTRSMTVWWGPDKIENALSLPNTGIMDQAYIDAHDSGDMLVNYVNYLPYAFSDWAALFYMLPEVDDLVLYDPGWNYICKDFAALDAEIGNAYEPPSYIGFEAASRPGRYLLLDVSGSMSVMDAAGDSAAKQVQEAAREIYGTASQVAAQEVIGIALYNSSVDEVLDYDTHQLEETLTFDPMGEFRAATGSTNIVLALERARDEIIANEGQRAWGAQIVLMSDGEQTVATAIDEVQTARNIWDNHDIAIDTVGYGRADDAILEAMQFGPNSHDSMLMRNPYSLHRLKMSLGEKYASVLGRQKVLNESGVLPVTGFVDDPYLETRVFWHTTTMTVPAGAEMVRVGAYPKYHPGSNMGITVTAPDATVYGGGFGSNPMMANGDYAAATITNPVAGEYTVTVYSLGVATGYGWLSAFQNHMDITAWAEAKDINPAVWTRARTIDAYNDTEFVVHARLLSPDALTGVDVVTSAIAADDSVVTTVTMSDDGTGSDETAADGIYTAILPTSLFTTEQTSVLTLRAGFTTSASTEPAKIVHGDEYEPVYNGAVYTVYAHTTVGVAVDDPANYAPTIDLSAFGGTAVERGDSHVAYLKIEHSVPLASQLGVQLGRGISTEDIVLVDTDGDTATYMVQFSVADDADLGPRNLAVAFGAVTMREPGFLAVVSPGNGNFVLTCPDGYNVITGTSGPDFLWGSWGNDCIFGFGGNDHLFGFGGNDILVGGDGADVIEGGGGDDILIGGKGVDYLHGDGGADLSLGGPGNDAINGGFGNDTIRGGSGADLLDGSWDDDVIYGDEGDDSLIGSVGTNTLNGGIGKDLCDGNLGPATIVNCEPPF